MPAAVLEYALWYTWDSIHVPSLHQSLQKLCVIEQVMTACLKSFAHGSNDTANAAGPFAAVQSLYLHGLDSCRDISTPLWVLAFCGVGIVAVRVSSHLASQAPHLLLLQHAMCCP